MQQSSGVFTHCLREVTANDISFQRQSSATQMSVGNRGRGSGLGIATYAVTGNLNEANTAAQVEGVGMAGYNAFSSQPTTAADVYDESVRGLCKKILSRRENSIVLFSEVASKVSIRNCFNSGTLYLLCVARNHPEPASGSPDCLWTRPLLDGNRLLHYDGDF
jgi:hypothetical protein